MKFVFFTSDTTDMISVLTTITYILHIFESKGILQSTDYKVLPKVNFDVEIKKISLFEKEGCEITIEPLNPKA